MNEWRKDEWTYEKFMCIPNVSFAAWDDLLKFDPTAWSIYQWSIYCASSKVQEVIHGDCKAPYIIWPYSDTGLYSGQASYLNMKVLLNRTICILF